MREATFNALGSLDAIDGVRVVDCFAGTGALGIEALSRGALHVTFLEQDREAVQLIEHNLQALDLADRATVVRTDALRWLQRGNEDFEVALADPPYAYGDWSELLESLPAPLAVVESRDEPELPSAWRTLRQRRYGGTLVTIITRTPTPE